jgi:hypothetical protein
MDDTTVKRAQARAPGAFELNRPGLVRFPTLVFRSVGGLARPVGVGLYLMAKVPPKAQTETVTTRTKSSNRFGVAAVSLAAATSEPPFARNFL